MSLPVIVLATLAAVFYVGFIAGQMWEAKRQLRLMDARLAEGWKVTL